MSLTQRTLLAGFLIFAGMSFISPLSLSGSAKKAVQDEYQEKVFHFEGKLNKASLPAPWSQNKFKTFQPLAKCEVIDAPFEKFKKALRITGKQAPTHIFTSAIQVKTGDVIKVDLVFRALDGKTPVQVGVYGEYQATNFKPVGKGWDRRYTYFEVRKPKTKFLRVFVHTRADTVVDVSHVVFRKLRPDEVGVFSPAKNLKLWAERTKGKNLARGKKVKFSPTPNYPLTARGKSDSTDLTNGGLYRGTGMLHFQPEAVGWNNQYGKVALMIDLGSVKAVKKAVIRLNGGRVTNLAFPKEITVWGSKDGLNFFQGQKLSKLGKLEFYLSNFREFYFLPEEENNQAPTYIYPFELELNAHARYIVIQMTPGVYSVHTDEVAVLEADAKTIKSPSFNENAKKITQNVFHESILVRPKMDTMYITEGLWFPNFLDLDCRKTKMGGKFSFTADLPASVQYSHSKEFPAFLRNHVKTEKKGNRVLYHFESKLPLGSKMLSWAKTYGYGPFYFRVENSKTVPEKERYIVLKTYCDGKLETTATLPVKFLKMPALPEFKYINNSMWLPPRTITYWPDFFNAARAFGLTYLPVFPEYPAEQKMLSDYLKAAARSKHKYRMVICPVKADKKSDFYCPTKSSTRTVCLAYKGPLYQEMLGRIREYARKHPADHITFDVESWEPNSMNNAMNCPRCDALRKKMKMNWVQYFSWGQAEYLKPFRKAVHDGAKAAGRKPPKIGFYALTPGKGIFRYSCKEGPVDFLGGYERMKNHLDEYQFSYYGRTASHVHNRARGTFAVLKDPLKSNPWISGGTGAYYGTPTYNMVKHHLLETLFNGSCGVQIYSFRSFESPLDYYNFAHALKEIAPYEELLMKGSLDFNFKGTHKQMLYTKREWKGKSLILIGNYGARVSAKTILPLKGKVTDVLTGKKFTAKGKLEITVPADDYTILSVE